MSDVILYKKQKDQLAKAAAKLFDAQAQFAQALATIGISAVAPTTDVSDDAAPVKKTRVKKTKGEKSKVEKSARNGGSAFAEM